MKILFEIPKEFEIDFKKDRFDGGLNRLKYDAITIHPLSCKNELNVADMLIVAFKQAEVLDTDIMKISLEIPEEYEEIFKKDRFGEALTGLRSDAEKTHLLAWKYELETADMLIESFKKANVISEKSLFCVSMFGETVHYINTSGLSVDGLIKAYAQCGKPFIDMDRYGKYIGIDEYAWYEQQNGELLFSVEFDVDDDTIKIFDGVSVDSKPLRETIGNIESVEHQSLYCIRMYGDSLYYINTSGMDAEELIKTYAECNNPFVDMNRYGKYIGAADYERRMNGGGELSVEFNADENNLKIISDGGTVYKSLSDTVAAVNEAALCGGMMQKRHGR